MGKVNTVQIKADNAQGFIIINESDFDEELHELFGVESNDDLDDDSEDELTPMSISEVIEGLRAMSIEDIKAAYSVDQLKAFCKEAGMRRYSKLNEDELIAKLLEKAE